jgi:serine protease Do
MKKKLFIMLVLLMFSTLLVGCFDLRAQLPYESPHNYEQLRISMIAEVEQSVVTIRTETGHGSGVIYKREALQAGGYRYYAMTNYHVIEDGGEMSVSFGPGNLSVPIKDVAGRQNYDIAVVRFDSAENFRVHKSAAIDDNVRVEIIKGQDVYAIGTPRELNFFRYTTQGIVSLPSITYNGISELALMHDAELNPGNSGGPLFNLKGELIGINVAKVASIPTKEGTIAAEGLNYSLNINKIAPVVRGFGELDFSTVERRPRLGITVQEVHIFFGYQDEAMTQEFPIGDPNYITAEERTRRISLLPANPVGVVVIGFDESRDAFGKLEEYDLIIRMNGNPITKIADIAAELDGAKMGDVHEVTVRRKSGETFIEVTVSITLS